MKFKFSFLTVTSLLAFFHAGTLAQAQKSDAELSQTIDLQVPDATLDSYLLELGRKANINIIADATDFSARAPLLPANGTHNMYWLMDKLEMGGTLTFHRYDSHTFLFWSPPDVVPVARKIVGGEGIRLVDKVLDDATLAQLLRDYLQRAQGWNGQTPDFAVGLKLADLPPELRSKLIARSQYDVLYGPRSFTVKPMKACLTEAFWEKATLHVIGKDRNEVLHVSATVPHMGGISFGFTDFSGPRAAPR